MVKKDVDGRDKPGHDGVSLRDYVPIPPAGSTRQEFQMNKLSRIAIAAAIFMCPPAGVLLAQSTPDSGTPAAPAPAATPAPAPEPAATLPAATTATDKATGTRKKRPAKKMTRQQEIDKSIDSGTVPSRYRSSVPKEYQQYVPFAK
jgi:hypothetical protein